MAMAACAEIFVLIAWFPDGVGGDELPCLVTGVQRSGETRGLTLPLGAWEG